MCGAYHGTWWYQSRLSVSGLLFQVFGLCAAATREESLLAFVFYVISYIISDIPLYKRDPWPPVYSSISTNYSAEGTHFLLLLYPVYNICSLYIIHISLSIIYSTWRLYSQGWLSRYLITWIKQQQQHTGFQNSHWACTSACTHPYRQPQKIYAHIPRIPQV